MAAMRAFFFDVTFETERIRFYPTAGTVAPARQPMCLEFSPKKKTASALCRQQSELAPMVWKITWWPGVLFPMALVPARRRLKHASLLGRRAPAATENRSKRDAMLQRPTGPTHFPFPPR